MPRHCRIIVFIDSAISEEALRQIMQACLHVWGGRYNPIVPVLDGKIAPEWLALINDFDPDYVYHSHKIPVDVLTNLQIFHPEKYVEFQEDGRTHIPGVNIHHLLHTNVHDRFAANGTTLLAFTGGWKLPIPAPGFYRLNFGFMSPYVGEDTWTGQVDLIPIDDRSASSINRLIREHTPYFKSNLSALHVHTMLPVPQTYHDFDRFQWLIYDATNYLTNLLYFWNRQLYIKPRNRLTQVVASEQEMNELLANEDLQHLVYYLSYGNPIYVQSIDSASERVEAFRKKMQDACPHIHFFTEPIDSFPFPIERLDRVESPLLHPTKHLVIGKSDFIRLPPLIFENGKTVDTGPYVIDICAEKLAGNERTAVKFPQDVLLHHLALRGATRVNGTHDISLFVGGSEPTVDYSVASDLEIIRSALHYRLTNNKAVTELPIEYTELSPAGKQLAAFLQLFDNDWSTVREFLEDKFWVQLFRFDSSDRNSNINAGKGIFCYQDLQAEIRYLAGVHRAHIIDRLKQLANQAIDDELIDDLIERDIADTFDCSINGTIDFLVAKGGLLMGMKVKCDTCGSNRWYSLAELNDKVNCKGCNNTTMPNRGSKVYYKISDILINNLLSDQTRNTKQFAGNYVVMKTLIYLKEKYLGSGQAFGWCGPLAYRTQGQAKNWSSDFDIAVLLNGLLILGEAKAQSNQFDAKEIDRLVWAANHLLPDKIIVSCISGDLGPVVQKIRDRVINPNCEVIAYNASQPWYHFRLLFGIQ